MECPSKLTPLLLALVKTLGQQLKFTTEVIQNTYQLLNIVYDQYQPEVSCPEWQSLLRWLQELSTHLLCLVEDLGRSENELLGKPEDEQHSPDGSVNSQSDGVKGKIIDPPLDVSSCQLPVPPPSPRGEENGSRPEDQELVELEKWVLFQENKSEEEKEGPVLVNSEDPNKSKTLGLVRKNSIEKDSCSEDSSVEKIHQNLISGDSGEKITVSPNLEEIGVENLQIMPAQETQAENEGFLDETKLVTLNLLRKLETINGDFDPKLRDDDGIGQCLEESSGRSEDFQKSHSIVPLIEKLEDEMDECTKEFFTEANGLGEAELSCSVTAPRKILEQLTVTVVNHLSPFVVNEAEELVSNVVSVECSSVDQLNMSPMGILIPCISRYRGMYKDIMVKVSDINFQSMYLMPNSLEGHQSSQKGSAAVVKTCQFGIFSVVSCLKKETWTIPRKGLSRKLNIDPRISFCYPPSTFSSRVTVDLKVQPIDQSTLSMLKAKHDEYHSVMSTSSLVHLEYSSSLPFNRAITVVLPSPPNQEKRREGIETDAGRATSASLPRVSSTHNFRFIIVRLSSATDHIHLVQFIQNLEHAIHNVMVKVLLCQNKEDPYKIVVLLVPSKELSMELQSLREEGYCGPPEPSKPFKMREGEQVYFRFNGNIFASDDGNTYGKNYKLAFHAQRKPRLALYIKEVDEFGNYSSPHYKGTALFYKVAKDSAFNTVEPLLLEDHEQDSFLCKLALTLPKKEKLISRPQSTKRVSTDISEVTWDNLLYWLSEELSEENANLLAQYLPLHRSTLQFIRLKCPDNLTEQIYELLCFWRRSLPRSADKLKLLSRYLCKIGRNDLAQHLQLKWANQNVMKKMHR
ncbi:death domain-containing protein 1 isoform X2 [Erythrolamprus reginae]|uniref:death domain-containing protein 1 isoform X2 n=1 Tax=Erythrolamprus reginae TaxID=121349 RepID=UPI00396D05B8